MTEEDWLVNKREEQGELDSESGAWGVSHKDLELDHKVENTHHKTLSASFHPLIGSEFLPNSSLKVLTNKITSL